MRKEDALLAATLLLLGFYIGHLYGGMLEGRANLGLTPQCLEGTVQPVFSPGAEEELVGLMEKATGTIDAQLFQFSFAGLKEALAKASARGVRVRLMLDAKVDSNLETATFLSGRGVEVRWSPAKYEYAHAKYAVVDGKKVEVGSINWSYNGMHRNREAAVIVEQEEVARAFEQKFEQDWKEATGVIG